MTEQEILERAIRYLQNLSEGIDPVSGEILEESCSFRSDRMIRFFRYLEGIVKDRLEQEKPKKLQTFYYKKVQYKGFDLVNKPISFTTFRRIMKQNVKFQFLTNSKLRELFVSQGYIKRDNVPSLYQATELGEKQGIIKNSINGKLLYTYDFQKAWIDRLLEIYNNPKAIAKANQLVAWSTEEDNRLTKEFCSEIAIDAIANMHGRSSTAIIARLKTLDLMEE